MGAFIRSILEFGANIAKLLLGIIPKVLDSPDVNLAEHIGKVIAWYHFARHHCCVVVLSTFACSHVHTKACLKVDNVTHIVT